MQQVNQHPNAAILVAIAEGKQVQFQNNSAPESEWVDFNPLCGILSSVGQYLVEGAKHLEWRIKPVETKVEGWVNVYPGNMFCFHATKDEAEDHASSELIACVPVQFSYEAKS